MSTETKPAVMKSVEEESEEFKEWIKEDEASDKEERNELRQRCLVALQSALLIRFVEEGLPKEQKALFYLLVLQFHEEMTSHITVYGSAAALILWYWPNIPTGILYSITRGIDTWQSHARNLENMKVDCCYHLCSLLIQIFVSFKGCTEILEMWFGPSTKWPAALLPIVPGIFLRFVNERPNSINGFVPENRQGLWMAVFIRACTAVLPPFISWSIWTAYSTPSLEYSSMFFEWMLCSFAWIWQDVSPLGAYAIWLLVNQYRHPRSWFLYHGGSPSVILVRERRGTKCYIFAIILMQIIENQAGPAILSSSFLTLEPQIWIPFALILVIGAYLLQYGLLLQVYKYKHQPLKGFTSIRLLRLRAQPCLQNSPIQCDMIYTTLKRPPQYTAISHRWDAIGAPREMILIDGGLFPVSQHMYSLLLAKRSPLHPKYFWIDSISINQEDDQEKNRQVGMMRNIFEEAEMTIGYLGDDPEAALAFKFVRSVLQVTDGAQFERLCTQVDSGYTQFQKFMASEWFERVWIIQEIAVSREQIIRYGDEELLWEDLKNALIRLMLYGFLLQKDDSILHARGILSVLVMEEVKQHIWNVDLIKLKDMLKLAKNYKSTLPIDKVYALLGLTMERHTPLFHPKFGVSQDIRKSMANNPNILAKDMVESMRLLTDLLGTASGSTNSRRARAILSSGADNAVRYMLIIMQDMKHFTQRLTDLKEGKQLFEEDESIQPDYSVENSAQLVYTYVARDLIKKNDPFAFIRYAGLHGDQSKRLEGLPSWVPDWSADIHFFILPQQNSPDPSDITKPKTADSQMPRKDDSHATEVGEDPVDNDVPAQKAPNPSKDPFQDSIKATSENIEVPVDPETEAKVENAAKSTPIHTPASAVNKSAFVDGGLKFLFVKGTVLGTIKHVTMLGHPYHVDEVQRGEHDSDYLQQCSRFAEAYEMARHHLLPSFQSEVEFEESFRSTLNSGQVLKDGKPINLVSMKPWPADKSHKYPLAAASWPPQSEHYRKDAERSEESAISEQQHEILEQQYKFVRRMNSSANTMFAHIIHTDVSDSIAKYCSSNAKLDAKREGSILHGDSLKLLSRFSTYVDYTIRRSFIVTDKGSMGLAPNATEPGDVIIRVRQHTRILDLLLREMPHPEELPAAIDAATDNNYKNSKKVDFKSTYRLVGEVYLHNMHDIEVEPDAYEMFRLW